MPSIKTIILVLSTFTLLLENSTAFLDKIIDGFKEEVIDGFKEDVIEPFKDDVIEPVKGTTDRVVDVFSSTARGTTDLVVNKVSGTYQIVSDAVVGGLTLAFFKTLDFTLNNAHQLSKVEDCGDDAIKDLRNPAQTILDDTITAFETSKQALTECYNSLFDPVIDLLSNIRDPTQDQFNDVLVALLDCQGLDKEILTIELFIGATLGAGISGSVGLVFDFNRDSMYVITSGCGELEFDLNISGGVAMSLFEDIDDVPGCSKSYSIGFETPFVKVGGGTVAVISVPGNQYIASGLEFDIGVNINPSSVGAVNYCFTFDKEFITSWRMRKV